MFDLIYKWTNKSLTFHDKFGKLVSEIENIGMRWFILKHSYLLTKPWLSLIMFNFFIKSICTLVAKFR